MAVLTDADRKDIWASIMRQEEISVKLTPAVTGLLKLELRAAVDAIDQWISDNAASFNAAIPQPARSALSSSQKAAILSYIASKRYKSGV